MLQRDIRKAARAQHSQRAEKQRRVEQTDRWTACSNSGVPATQDVAGRWSGTPNLYFFPKKPATASGPPRSRSILVCYECKSAWSTDTNVRHP